MYIKTLHKLRPITLSAPGRHWRKRELNGQFENGEVSRTKDCYNEEQK